MKWGVRRKSNVSSTGSTSSTKSKKQERREARKQEKEQYVAKAKKVAANTKNNGYDRNLASYAAKSSASKMANELTKAISASIIEQQFSNKPPKSTSDVINEAMAQINKKNALAKSSLKKYDDDGNLKSGKKKSLISREQLLSLGMDVAPKVYSAAGKVAAQKYSEVKNNRKKNEEAFDRWGGRILEQSPYSDAYDPNDRIINR